MERSSIQQNSTQAIIKTFPQTATKLLTKQIENRKNQ
jgi:hypothetical protein